MTYTCQLVWSDETLSDKTGGGTVSTLVADMSCMVVFRRAD